MQLMEVGNGNESKEKKRSRRPQDRIPAERAAELGIGEGDKFTVRKTKAGIALKAVRTEK